MPAFALGDFMVDSRDIPHAWVICTENYLTAAIVASGICGEHLLPDLRNNPFCLSRRWGFPVHRRSLFDFTQIGIYMTL
jgi:hypothetical protein